MNLLAEVYQASRLKDRAPLLSGLDHVSHQLSGWRTRQKYSSGGLLKHAEVILQQSLGYQQLSLEQLQQQLTAQQQLIKRCHADQAHTQQALALLCEASARILNLRPYPVQIMGTLLLQQGCLAEMATGEGKSLVICLAAILAAWAGKPCHLVTANDYLASRDAQQFADLYRFCGLSCGVISATLDSGQRRQQYRQAIVYATSQELLADFLRDQLALGGRRGTTQRLLELYLGPQNGASRLQVMRGIHTAIIDEADSVLIDEATMPLIISQAQPNPILHEACKLAYRIASQLDPAHEYGLYPDRRKVELTSAGEKRIGALLQDFPAFFRAEERCKELVLLALTAKEFFQPGQHYVVEEQKIIIIDDFTGRKMDQRTWQQGLQQMIEVKEDVPLSDPSESLAQLSFQIFFNLFQKLSGTSGTAWETRNEFWQLYSLPVVPVPLNRPEQRKQEPLRNSRTMQEKYAAIVADTLNCYQRGQPVLIGSRSILQSEEIGQRLRQAGLECQLLNALNHQQEAEIIANAGQARQITVATNMAGRGADIKLGEGVAELGGLHVIVAELNESKRIDRQLLGRCARQGEPGSYRLYISGEDEILGRLKRLKIAPSLANNGLGRLMHTQKLTRLMLAAAQAAIQNMAKKQRRELAKRDEWLKEMLP